jgi:hypothetical protein
MHEQRNNNNTGLLHGGYLTAVPDMAFLLCAITVPIAAFPIRASSAIVGLNKEMITIWA